MVGRDDDEGDGYPRWVGLFAGRLTTWEQQRLRRYTASLIEQGADTEWWTRAEANRLRFARFLVEQGIVGEWEGDGV